MQSLVVYINVLFKFDEALLRDLKPLLLPIENKRLRYAAWEMILLNQFSLELYNLFESEFELAIKELPRPVNLEKFHQDPTLSLACVLANAFLGNLEKLENSKFSRFLERADAAQRTKVVTFLSTLKPEGAVQHQAKLKEFWESRIAFGDPDELRAFGTWTKAPLLNDTSTIELLRQTLVKTQGAISSKSHHVIHFVQRIAVASVKDSINLLALLTQFSNTSELSMMETELLELIGRGLSAEDSGVVKVAETLRDKFLSIGLEQFRRLPE